MGQGLQRSVNAARAKAPEPNRYTQAELLAEAKRRFGDDPMDFAFTCPGCGDVATIRDFKAVRHEGRHRDGSTCTGHPEAAGQECIGRLLGALRAPQRAWEGRGCDWCAFGLIPCPWAIEFPDGHTASSFRLAPGGSKPPPCDWDTGTASSGPSGCGRPAKYIWADETSGRDRLVCGIHARSVKAKFHGEVTPIAEG